RPSRLSAAPSAVRRTAQRCTEWNRELRTAVHRNTRGTARGKQAIVWLLPILGQGRVSSSPGGAPPGRRDRVAPVAGVVQGWPWRPNARASPSGLAAGRSREFL